MIIAGTRPPEYAAALRAERAKRAADAEQRGKAVTDRDADAAESVDDMPDSHEQTTSAVDIAPRPPAD